MKKKYNVTVNGTTYEVEVEEVGGVQPQAAPAFKAPPAQTAPAPTADVNAVSGEKFSVNAEMAGEIIAVNVKENETIEKGKVLLILEAMKMETNILSPVSGTVSQIKVKSGDRVDSGDALVLIKVK